MKQSPWSFPSPQWLVWTEPQRHQAAGLMRQNCHDASCRMERLLSKRRSSRESRWTPGAPLSSSATPVTNCSCRCEGSRVSRSSANRNGTTAKHLQRRLLPCFLSSTRSERLPRCLKAILLSRQRRGPTFGLWTRRQQVMQVGRVLMERS